MSQIEDIYKRLEEELPSADFNLDSSGEEVGYYRTNVLSYLKPFTTIYYRTYLRLQKLEHHQSYKIFFQCNIYVYIDWLIDWFLF